MRFRGPKAECDRCGGEFHYDELEKQQQAAGRALTWTGWLVCPDCLDRVDIKFVNPPLDDPIPIFPPNFGKTR